MNVFNHRANYSAMITEVLVQNGTVLLDEIGKQLILCFEAIDWSPKSYNLTLSEHF